MSCCKNAYLFDEKSECGCIHEACFHCNSWTIISWCKDHNPEGGTQ